MNKPRISHAFNWVYDLCVREPVILAVQHAGRRVAVASTEAWARSEERERAIEHVGAASVGGGGGVGERRLRVEELVARLLVERVRHERRAAAAPVLLERRSLLDIAAAPPLALESRVARGAELVRVVAYAAGEEGLSGQVEPCARDAAADLALSAEVRRERG